MKKIIILVMSCNDNSFVEHEQAIRKTWARPVISGKYPNVEYYSYAGSADGKYHINRDTHQIMIPCDDGLWGTTEKTIKCFRFITSNLDFDYAIRVNTSTYLNIELVMKLIDETYDDMQVFTTSLLCKNYCSGPYNYNLVLNGKCLIVSKKIIGIIVDTNNILEALNHDYCTINYPECKKLHVNPAEIPGFFKQEKICVDDYFMSIVLNVYFIKHNIAPSSKYRVIGENDFFYIDEDQYHNYVTLVYKDREISGFYGKNMKNTRDAETSYAVRIDQAVNDAKTYELDTTYYIMEDSPVFFQNDLLSYHFVDECVMQQLIDTNDEFYQNTISMYNMTLQTYVKWAKNNTSIVNP